MNLLIENGTISEMECGSNFSYLLNDSSNFLSTEYKVLQSQTNGRFVKSMKMLYNGKVELFYLTENYKPLSSLLPKISADTFFAIITNFFANIIETKNNGFLSCKNINISFDKVFIDTATNKVKLVYLPINQHFFSDELSFENELRINIIKTISNVAALSSPRISQLSLDLQNGTLSLESIYSQLGGTYSFKEKEEPKAAVGGDASKCKLVAVNASQRIELVVDKDEYTIGKKDGNDGVVSFNKMISRVHCKITKKHNQYWITDLQSANGTYINHIRLQANQPHMINNGDVVRMADSDFQVVIG